MSVGTRVLWATVLVVLAVGLWARPAHAGGSVWKLDAEHHQPGDRAFAWASVSWEHSSTLGTPDEGPYVAYLAPFDPGPPVVPWPPLPADAVRVAEVQIDLGPYDAGGVKFGPHHATIEFTVPELPAGQYTVMHCNSPCTTTLGDITSGRLVVDPVSPPIETAPPPRSPPETAPPETSPPETAPPKTAPRETAPPMSGSTIAGDESPSRPSDLDPFLIAGVSLGAVGAVAGSAARHRLATRAKTGR